MIPQAHANCGECGLRLDEPTNFDPEMRSPCPDCGSLVRRVHLYASDTITVHERIKLEQKRPGWRGRSGRRRALREVISGDEQSDDGTWVHHTRVIDRENDYYEETVRRPGNPPYHLSGRLSDHIGHGSDRARG
jgi:predicted  nucleic acid-binding Zn-ribbon protein